MFRIILVWAVLTSASNSAELRVLDWPDLKPDSAEAARAKAAELQRSVFSMSAAQRDALRAVQLERDVRDKLRDGRELSAEEQALLSSPPGERYPEARAFFDQLDAANQLYRESSEAVRAEMDGLSVRIPGYVLPLEFAGDEVTEFLLVPYVGACIHAPTPAANQMVHVTSSMPFKSSGLFVPVWVEGRLAVHQGSYDLTLVDGSAPVEAGYALEADLVERYTK